MGCKTCMEKIFGVEFGPRGFRSGLPSPLIAPFVIVFIGIFLVVGGILLCIIHQTYIVARHDQLYEADNYFLIAGVVALCLGVVVVLVGMGWCYHVHSAQADQIEDYKLRKGYSSESINRSRPGSMSGDRASVHDRTWSRSDYPQQGARGDRMASSASYHSHHQRQMPIPHGHHPHYDADPRYPHDPRYGQDLHYPQGSGYNPDDPRSPRDPATRANRGFEDFKSFVKRNTEASRSPRKQKQSYSDRLSGPPQGYRDDDDVAGSRGDTSAQEEEGEFDLARTYIQNPAQYYAQEAERQEDQHSGYELMPVDHPSRQAPDAKARERMRFEGGSVDPRARHSGHGKPDSINPAQRSSAYRYENGRPHNSSQDSNTPVIDPNPQAEGVTPAPSYRYNKGRPTLDSSHDSGSSITTDASVNMAPTGAPAGALSVPHAHAPPPVGKEKATLVYNPKDGQWYYYYKGKPISKYDPHSINSSEAQGPMYKYINGKPILLPPPTQPLT